MAGWAGRTEAGLTPMDQGVCRGVHLTLQHLFKVQLMPLPHPVVERVPPSCPHHCPFPGLPLLMFAETVPLTARTAAHSQACPC